MMPIILITTGGLSGMGIIKGNIFRYRYIIHPKKDYYEKC